jgi:hypothetical protein
MPAVRYRVYVAMFFGRAEIMIGPTFGPTRSAALREAADLWRAAYYGPITDSFRFKSFSPMTPAREKELNDLAQSLRS